MLGHGIFYFIDLFLNFKPFNSKLNYIKYENKIFFQDDWIFILLEVQDSPPSLPISWFACTWKENQIFKKIWFVLKRKYCTFITQSFFTLFAILIHSINTKHYAQQETRNPSPCTNPYFAKKFLKVVKIVFEFPASFRPIWGSKRVQEVPSKQKHPSLEAKTAQNSILSLLRFGTFVKFEFHYSYVVNAFCVFVYVQDIH